MGVGSIPALIIFGLIFCNLVWCGVGEGRSLFPPQPFILIVFGSDVDVSLSLETCSCDLGSFVILTVQRPFLLGCLVLVVM